MNEILNYTLFTIGADKPVLLIDLVTSVVGLTCVFLAGRNSKYNFWIGYLYTMLLALMFWNKHVYASLILQPISLCINILGHYRWTHPKKEEESSQKAGELKVTMLSWPQRLMTASGILLMAGVWGWFLSMLGNKWFIGVFPSDPVPYLDACLTILIISAQFLSALKKWDCWVAWILVNITQIILHISVGHIFMPIVSGLYLINAIASIISWRKLYDNKA